MSWQQEKQKKGESKPAEKPENKERERERERERASGVDQNSGLLKSCRVWLKAMVACGKMVLSVMRGEKSRCMTMGVGCSNHRWLMIKWNKITKESLKLIGRREG